MGCAVNVAKGILKNWRAEFKTKEGRKIVLLSMYLLFLESPLIIKNLVLPLLLIETSFVLTGMSILINLFPNLAGILIAFGWLGKLLAYLLLSLPGWLRYGGFILAYVWNGFTIFAPYQLQYPVHYEYGTRNAKGEDIWITEPRWLFDPYKGYFWTAVSWLLFWPVLAILQKLLTKVRKGWIP